MFNIFDGLDKFGFSEANSIDIHEKEVAAAIVAAKKELTAEDIVYFKDYECPVCQKIFKHSAVKLRGAKYTHSDTDLRMYYSPIDPMYYDVVLCSHCGYASTTKNFAKVTTKQEELIKEKITPNYISKEYPLLLTVDHAIERYKLALLNAHLKKAKDGEKAYLCLKLAWLYRDKCDSFSELGCIGNAIKGFSEAFQKESFPICGLDENTLTYILADLHRRVGQNEESLRYLGRLIVDKTVPDKLRNKARDLKELIREATTPVTFKPAKPEPKKSLFGSKK